MVNKPFIFVGGVREGGLVDQSWNAAAIVELMEDDGSHFSQNVSLISLFIMGEIGLQFER